MNHISASSRRPRLAVPAILVASIVTLTGCSKKKDALAEYEKIEAACKEKDAKKANDIALKAAEANSSFKKAFEATFADVGDKAQANVCGLYGVELKSRIENGPMF